MRGGLSEEKMILEGENQGGRKMEEGGAKHMAWVDEKAGACFQRAKRAFPDDTEKAHVFLVRDVQIART